MQGKRESKVGKFKEYFERAKSSGLNETIKVPVFESKQELLDWLDEISKDVELDAVVARDDVYHPVTEDIFISAGDSLAELKEAVSTCEAWELSDRDSHENWSPTMQKYLKKTSVPHEKRVREKDKDKEEFAKETRKVEGVANKYLKRLKEVEDSRTYWHRSAAQAQREQERELKAEFKGITLAKLVKEYRDMGSDMAADALADFQRYKLSSEDLKDKFDEWSQSAAQDAAYGIFQHPLPDVEKQSDYLKKVEGIEYPSDWAADEIYEGMIKCFKQKVK